MPKRVLLVPWTGDCRAPDIKEVLIGHVWDRGDVLRGAGSGRRPGAGDGAARPPRAGRPAPWISPDGRVGLGHARLSIIDLATGDQPIASEDERLRIVVNGEFYDFERVQRDLERRGHRLRTRSDSEIALHLYEDLGTACLQQLRGEFAFALWDGRNDTLFAARDRFGIKPLFYAQHGGALYLASEIKALFAAGVPARWDRDAFFQATTPWLRPARTAPSSTASPRCRPATTCSPPAGRSG